MGLAFSACSGPQPQEVTLDLVPAGGVYTVGENGGPRCVDAWTWMASSRLPPSLVARRLCTAIQLRSPRLDAVEERVLMQPPCFKEQTLSRQKDRDGDGRMPQWLGWCAAMILGGGGLAEILCGRGGGWLRGSASVLT